MRSACVLLVCLLLIAIAAPTQTTNPGARIVRQRQAQPQSVPGQKPVAAPAQHAPAADQQELAALRTDLARMRVLLNQMRTNLAFVQTSDTPLKHQFDLNNEMWQMLLNDLDRRLQRMEQPKP